MPRTSETNTAKPAAVQPPRLGSSSGAAGQVDDELAAVVRRLGERAAESPPLRDAHVGGERVLLDVSVDGYRCLLLAARPAIGAHHALSPREQEIVRMVAEGYPTKTIAAVLDISSWTVSTYLRRIFAKLDVRSRAAMVARALEEGLVAKTEIAGEPRPTSRP
jgi:DNA-binding CsgD family transcriptional regulator